MHDLIEIWDEPASRDNCMIAGWKQWADAGEISSGLPQYVVEQTGARKIGEIKPDRFYLFQIPGTHHLMRPQVKLVDGYCQQMSTHQNDLFYTSVGGRGLLVFAGEEPHQNEEGYAEAFFDMVAAVKVRRVVALGGVYGAMPYNKDREISCVYSLPEMKTELENYAANFSNYEGGTTIGTYLAHQAERRGVEFVVFYAFAPAYELSQLGLTLQAMRVEEDWKAWHDIMRRVDYMLRLGLDLSDLEARSRDLIEAWDNKIEKLAQKRPELDIKTYMERVADGFVERPFIPLDDAWDELSDLFTEEGE